jgi:hypothetical protein
MSIVVTIATLGSNYYPWYNYNYNNKHVYCCYNNKVFVVLLLLVCNTYRAIVAHIQRI